MFTTIKNVYRLINRELPKEQLYDAKMIMFHAKDDPAKKPSFQLDVLEPMFRELRQYAGGNRVYLGKQKSVGGKYSLSCSFYHLNNTINALLVTHDKNHYDKFNFLVVYDNRYTFVFRPLSKIVVIRPLRESDREFVTQCANLCHDQNAEWGTVTQYLRKNVTDSSNGILYEDDYDLNEALKLAHMIAKECNPAKVLKLENYMH